MTPVIASIIPNDVMLAAPRPAMGIKFWALHALLTCYTVRCALSAFVLEVGREPAAVRSQLFPFIMWVPGIKLRPAVLTASTFAL